MNGRIDFLIFSFNLPNQCKPSKTEPGDGIDNDCDGKIDEEILDKKDNDGDGKIDEDLQLVNHFPLFLHARGAFPVGMALGGFTLKANQSHAHWKHSPNRFSSNASESNSQIEEINLPCITQHYKPLNIS